MRKITVICREFYPDPLIYTVEVNDPTNEAEVRHAAVKARIDEIGGEDPDVDATVARDLKVYFAFEGDVRTIADWRE